MDLPADYMLQSVSNVDFDVLKQEFERMFDVSDKLKQVKNATELPESLEAVDLNVL